MNITAPLEEVKEFWKCCKCSKFNAKLDGNIEQEDDDDDDDVNLRLV
jgi:hypothetical protein